jgi:hypothetical protein
MRPRQDAVSGGGHMCDYDVVLSPRSWRFILALHRVRYRVRSAMSRLRLPH